MVYYYSVKKSRAKENRLFRTEIVRFRLIVGTKRANRILSQFAASWTTGKFLENHEGLEVHKIDATRVLGFVHWN